jgi:carbonic anhydrase/acetyltransferase-like protein (isoleucine patch superfamily)
MLIKHRGKSPTIDPSAYIAPTATIVGDVTIRKGARILYGAIINAEGSRIEIGEGSIVLENAVLRATDAGNREHPVILGRDVFISPHVTVLGADIRDHVFLSTGVTVLHGAVVHESVVAGVGSFIHGETVIPKGFFVPPNTIAVGNPFELFGPPDKLRLLEKIESIKFPKIAYNVDDGSFSDSAGAATRVRVREFTAHFEDEIISEDHLLAEDTILSA